MNNTNQLRQIVRDKLSECDQYVTPNLFERLQSLDGYSQVEQMVIDYIIVNDVSVGTAISMIETEL